MLIFDMNAFVVFTLIAVLNICVFEFAATWFICFPFSRPVCSDEFCFVMILVLSLGNRWLLPRNASGH